MMKTRQLGTTDIHVGVLALGTMMFGGRTDESEARRILDMALDAGVTLVDTADVYTGGESERIVGRALRSAHRRERVVIATKGGFPRSADGLPELGRQQIIDACEASLRRLGTDHIDLYQLHRPNPRVPIGETLQALDDLVSAGKVRHIGSSMFPGWRLVEAAWAAAELGTSRFVSEQAAYNILDRTVEREVVPAARSLGMAMLAWGPLAGGLLTASAEKIVGTGGSRWTGGTDPTGRQLNATTRRVLTRLGGIARGRDLSVAQLSLAWLIAQPGITAAVIGPRTSAQARDNLAVDEIVLDAHELAEIDRLVAPRSSVLTYYDNAPGLTHANLPPALRTR